MNELTEEQLEQLDLYISSGLTPEDHGRIGSLIANDPVWMENYTLRLATREVARNAFHQSMRKTFISADAENKTGRSIRPVWFLAAASIAALISVVLWIFPGKTSQSLLAEYKTFPNVVLPIEKSATSPGIREKAYQSYEIGAYDTAIENFSLLDTVRTVDRLYHGLSFLEAGKYSEAGVLIDEVRASSDTRWREVADWYGAWLLLRQGDTDGAKKAFQRIAVTPGHRYETDAQKVITRL